MVAVSRLAPSRSYERIYAVVRRIPRGRVATYGQVAKLAGLPRETIARATEVLESLAVHTSAPPSDEEVAETQQPRDQLDLFDAPEHPAVGALRDVDIEVLSPLAAFDALRRIRAMAEE